MSGDRIFYRNIRGALITYFETTHLIEDIENPDELRKILRPESYSRYLNALDVLRTTTLQGDELIDILSDGDDTYSKLGPLVRILSNNSKRINTKT